MSWVAAVHENKFCLQTKINNTDWSVSDLGEVRDFLSLNGRCSYQECEQKKVVKTHHSKINETSVNCNDMLAQEATFVGTGTTTR